MIRKILVVEDEKISRNILAHFLSINQYDVFTADNGMEALEILRKEEEFSAIFLDLYMPVMDGYTLLQIIRSDKKLCDIPVLVQTIDAECESRALDLGANDFILKPFKPSILVKRLYNTIDLREKASIVNAAKRDGLTGLYSRNTFLDLVGEMVSKKEAGFYVLTCFDIERFRMINDLYGTVRGDEVLKAVARKLMMYFDTEDGICCRINADNFAILYPRKLMDTPKIQGIIDRAKDYFNILSTMTFSIGRYIIDDKSLSPSSMYDRAMIAKATVKGRYDVHLAIYDESMRNKILSEQEIVSEMKNALETHQFEVWYQPQYNHESGALTGAEALVRWRHPEKGLIAPGVFIPIFEQNGFVYEIDKYVWKESCIFMRQMIDAGRTPVPVSVNISRYDIFQEGLSKYILDLVNQYHLKTDLLRLEITESAFAKSGKQVISVVEEFKANGFIVEIDDFGSGYSSLNTLKDVPADVLKLDMRFLEGENNSDKGGNIIASIIRMAKWLGMAVIAEGVETIQQANFLKSIGCNYIQGYLYSKPLPRDEYEKVLKKSEHEETMLTMEKVETYDVEAFWNPESMETLIFNSFVGGACIFEYCREKIDLLRVNEKYIKILGDETLTESELLKINVKDSFTGNGFALALKAMKKAISTGEEVLEELEFVNILNPDKKIHCRAMIRVIAATGDRYLFYCVLEDISEQWKAEQKERILTDELRTVMNNAGNGMTAVIMHKNRNELLFSNDKFYEILGYHREDYLRFTDKDVYSTIHPLDRERVRYEAQKITAEKINGTIECRVIRQDGNVIWVKIGVDVTNIFGIEDPIQISVFTDITEEKEANAQLRFLNDTAHDILDRLNESDTMERTLSSILNHFGGERSYVIELDYQNKVSNSTYEICTDGIKTYKKHVVNTPFEDTQFVFEVFKDNKIVYTTVENCLNDTLRNTLIKRGANQVLLVPILREGQMIGILGVDNPTASIAQTDRLLALGDYIAVLITNRDLNNTIKLDDDAMTVLMSDIPGGFCRFRLHAEETTEIMYCNEGFCNMLQMSHEEVMKEYGSDAYACIFDEKEHSIDKRLKRIPMGGEQFSEKCKLKRKDGSFIWVMVQGRFGRNASGALYLNTYYADVTGQIEEETRQKELLDNLPCGAALFEFYKGELNVIHLNKQYWKLVEREAAGNLNLSVFGAIHPEDAGILRKETEAALRQNRDLICDLRIQCGEEGYKAFHTVGSFHQRKDGRYMIYTTYTPINEEAMSFQEMLPIALSTVMSASDEIAYIKDRDLRYICCSNKSATNLGLQSPVDVIGKSDYDLFKKEAADRLNQVDRDIMQNKEPKLNYIIEMNDALDNKKRTFIASKYPLLDTSGNVIGIYGITRDITNEKEQEYQLQLLSDNIPGGLASYAIHGEKITTLYINEGFAKCFGYSKEEFLEVTKDDPLALMYEDGRQVIANIIKDFHDNPTQIDLKSCVYRCHTKDGKTRYMNIKGKRTKTSDDDFIMNVVQLDITEQMEKEEQLRQLLQNDDCEKK